MSTGRPCQETRKPLSEKVIQRTVDHQRGALGPTGWSLRSSGPHASKPRAGPHNESHRTCKAPSGDRPLVAALDGGRLSTEVGCRCCRRSSGGPGFSHDSPPVSSTLLPEYTYLARNRWPIAWRITWPVHT